MNAALSIPAFAPRRDIVRGGLFLACCGEAALVVDYGLGVELAFAQGEGGEAALAPEWVQVMPAGPAITARDGRKWTLTDPSVLVAAFAANKADLPFDINHASELLAPKGEDAPAQGWVKALEVREGRVWARVDWTPAGAQLVTSKAYRYVSPAFAHDRAGNIVAIRSVALVTQPALDMPALARDEGQAPKDHPSMSLLARAAEALGLAATATDDDVIRALDTQVSLARDARDPAKLVPASDLTAALARAATAETALAAITANEKETAATTAVDQAIAAGKITEAAKEHWLSIARDTPDAFAAAVATMPSIVSPTDTRRDPNADKTGELGLTADELALCHATGTDPVAFAATRKQEGAAR